MQYGLNFNKTNNVYHTHFNTWTNRIFEVQILQNNNLKQTIQNDECLCELDCCVVGF